ncbi:Splicing factor U2af large subunit B [Capsicum chinense]|nr:Splicing factor U2af large subunit B [Capsicum chinense]
MHVLFSHGASFRVRRPSDYNPSLASTLDPSQPNPNLAAVGLSPSSADGLEGPDRIFVGGLPYYFTEAQIRELLESFGPLRGFDLVKDRETGNSKGYAFCVYQDVSVTDIACAALNGIKMVDKTHTVMCANQGSLVNVVIPRPGSTSEHAPGARKFPIDLPHEVFLNHGAPMIIGPMLCFNHFFLETWHLPCCKYFLNPISDSSSSELKQPVEAPRR